MADGRARDGCGPRRARVAEALALAAALVLVSGPARPAASEAALARVPEGLPGAPPFPPPLRARLAETLAALGPDYVPRTKNLRADGSPLYTNRLLLETSPYLRQHAHNPVDWHPWGDEAFAIAGRLGRPVLVSIGYSTCHWCHVMEEETFDDPEIVEYLNRHFVAVKVDRESRPDVDAVYMTAIHAMRGRGGWPLNVFVNPERKPFFAGTYFPPVDREGRPGFPQVLRRIQSEYAADPGRIDQFAEQLTRAIEQQLEASVAQSSQIPDEGVLAAAVAGYARGFDWTWGGMGQGTKFPSSTPVRLLLRYHRRSGDDDALRMATLTLEKMMAGGLRDHVGGGFHRYSTERRWLVPHFEKMLYDNALLIMDYSEAAQATGREDFARVARETLRYVAREMTAPEGGFYSATDADSPNPEGEREEGWFFTWTPAEIEAAVGPEEAKLVAAYYGVTPGGNFEGRNILHAWRSEAEVAGELGLPPSQLRQRLERSREKLYGARSQRPPPLRDEKILAAWNGLMIQAFARASLVLGEPDWAEKAARAADFVLTHMRVDGRLRRAFKDGRADGPAFLEDYAFLIAGLLDLYEARPDPHWLGEALALQATLDAHYGDETGGGYFKTPHDHERLLAREKPGQDGAIPSGNSVAARNLLRLADLTGDASHRERATLLFSAFQRTLEQHPTALAQMLLALDYELDTAKEVVLVRPEGGGDAAPMLAILSSTYAPNRVLSIATEGADLDAHAALVPLAARKVARGGRVTAYVCENRVCDFPTSDPEVFAKQLGRVEPLRREVGDEAAPP